MARRTRRSVRRRLRALPVLCLAMGWLIPAVAFPDPASAVDGSIADCKGPFFDTLTSVFLGPLKALGIVDPTQPGWEWVDQVDPLRELE
ncbi:MAG TPA: hypothetical protein VGJ86_25415, partial [Acidimicrobiales bacterium]